MKRRGWGNWLRGTAAVALLCGAGCAHDQPKPKPPPPPHANVTGLTVLVEPPAKVETTSADCTAGESALMESLPAALQRAAEKSLTNAGFTVVTAKGDSHALTAKIDATLAYCSNSEAHIATGETGLSLVDGTRVVSRAAQSGDLASPLDTILARVVDELMYAPPVIEYSKQHNAH